MKLADLDPRLWTAKVIAIVVAVIFFVCLFGFMYWRTFIAPGRAEQKAQVIKAQADQKVGQAQGQAGQNAVGVVAKNAAAESKTHEITRDHYYEITKQPGADDPVSADVFDAFVRSVCVRPSASGLSDCQRLSEIHPEGVAQGSGFRADPTTQDDRGTGRIR